MPLIYSCYAVAPPIYPQRCNCGRVIGHLGITFYALQCQGLSRKEALDRCGLPMASPFQKNQLSNQKDDPTPPSPCCRATLMTVEDPHARISLLQHILAAAEGPASVGLEPLHKNEEKDGEKKKT